MKLWPAIFALASLEPAAFAAAPSDRDAWSPHETRVIVGHFAKCVVRSHHDEAREAILTDASEQEIKRKYHTLIDERCLVMANPAHDSELRFSFLGFRFALAGALVAVDFPVVRPWNFEALPAVTPIRPSAAATTKDGETAPDGRVDPEQVGFNECVSRRSPTQVQALMFTAPDSAEEDAAFAALGPTFTSCAEVGQMAFERDFLRGTLAVAFYRLATAGTGPRSES